MLTNDVIQPLNYTINSGPAIIKLPNYITTPEWCPVVSAARQLLSVEPTLEGPDLDPVFFLNDNEEYMMINLDYTNALDSEDYQNRLKDVGKTFKVTVRSIYFTSEDGDYIYDD